MKQVVSFVVVLALFFAGVANADLIAQEDFDGGDVNLTSSTVPALDGGPGDYFGVGSRNGWPQGFPDPGVPFSIGDDTVVGYSNDGPAFPDDTEGVFGQNSDFDNNYFAISDSDEFGVEQTASWTFDISGAVDLTASVDFGGISNASFGGYSSGTTIVFTAQIDGGATQTIFSLAPVTDETYLTRPMDIGTQSGGGALLQVTGDGLVTKYLAEDGTAAADTYLDKTPPDGAGAGELDTFTTAIAGTGNALVITMTADVPFEALVFDNIVIEGMGAIPTEQKSWGEVKQEFAE